MDGSGGTAPSIHTRHIVAVYDPADGRVRHLHHVLIFEGGRQVERASAEAEAMDNARQCGLDTAALRAIYVGDALPDEPGALRVDVGTGRLVVEPFTT